MSTTSPTASQAATPRPASRRAKPGNSKPRAAAASPHDGEERETIIRRMAYAHYEARGYVGGHALDDWLKAQAEFEAASSAHPPA